MIEKLVVLQCQCEECGHSWVTEGVIVPSRCAKCKSRRWNRGIGMVSEIAEKVEAEGRVEKRRKRKEDLKADVRGAVQAMNGLGKLAVAMQSRPPREHHVACTCGMCQLAKR